MKGFIIYPTYRIINARAYIYLFGKLENGQSFLTITPNNPYFFIKTKDLENARELLKEYSIEKTNLKTFKRETVAKIILDIPGEVPTLRRSLEESGIECYEADIRFAYRFLIDKNLKGSVNIEGDYETGEYVDRIYNDPEITPVEYFPQLKIISIDIETSLDGKHLYSIALYSKDYKKVFLISDTPIENASTFRTEESLLESFKSEILLQDPDIITGWNLIDFDFRFLYKKFKEHKIPFTLGRTNQECKIKIEQDFFKDSKADFLGRMVLDGIHLLRSSFIALDDYRLNTAAYTLLKEEKILDDENKATEIDNLFFKDKNKLVSYNLKDAELAYKILEKTKVIELTIQRSLITGLALDRVRASIASLDSMYLRKLREKNYVAPSTAFNIKEKPITGGYVMESKPGIYEYIIVLDFKSLYPSIMKTFNIDPLSYLGEIKTKDAILAPNKAAFSREPGILPLIITEIMKARDIAKERKDEVASHALKIHLNSLFGVLANPTCRFFNTNIANAITHFGQYLIKLTAKKIEEKGLEVIYQDTDSNFVDSKVRHEKEAEKLGVELQNYINKFFNSYIKKEYNLESYLELEFEKIYKAFLMPRIRGGEAGAKKRYAGLLIEDGKEKLDFVGLEFIRGDWTELAKKFQYELLDRIFHKKEVTSFIKKYVSDIRKGKYDSLLIYKKSIRQDLNKYAVQAQHVKAAKKLPKLTSRVIRYVITTDGPEPIQQIKHSLDYEHYIQKQIKPIADTILSFYNTTFEELLAGSKQRTLFNY